MDALSDLPDRSRPCERHHLHTLRRLQTGLEPFEGRDPIDPYRLAHRLAGVASLHQRDQPSAGFAQAQHRVVDHLNRLEHLCC